MLLSFFLVSLLSLVLIILTEILIICSPPILYSPISFIPSLHFIISPLFILPEKCICQQLWFCFSFLLSCVCLVYPSVLFLARHAVKRGAQEISEINKIIRANPIQKQWQTFPKPKRYMSFTFPAMSLTAGFVHLNNHRSCIYLREKKKKNTLLQ